MMDFEKIFENTQSENLSVNIVAAKIRILWATYNALHKRIIEVCDYNIKNSEFPDYVEENKRLKEKYYKKMRKIKEKARFLEEVLDILKKKSIDTPYGCIAQLGRATRS